MKSNKFLKGIKILKTEGFLSFIKKTSIFMLKRVIKRCFLFHFILLPYYIMKLKSFPHNNLEKLVNFSFRKLNSIVKPMQVEEEIIKLLKILEKKNLKTALEIGTANGGTLFLLSRIINKNGLLISVDLPRGMFGGGYPRWKSILYKSFALSHQKLILIREDSHQRDTFKMVRDILSGRKLDLLFIDGDHDNPKIDFELYKPLVRKGGLIVFHDIVSGPKEKVGNVPLFWQDIKKRFSHEEIVRDWNQGGYGIGIIIND